MKKNILKRHFHLTNKSEIIYFTPITEIFNPDEMDLIESWRLREHLTHPYLNWSSLLKINAGFIN